MVDDDFQRLPLRYIWWDTSHRRISIQRLPRARMATISRIASRVRLSWTHSHFLCLRIRMTPQPLNR